MPLIVLTSCFDLIGDFVSISRARARLTVGRQWWDIHLGEAVDAEQREGEHADDRERKVSTVANGAFNRECNVIA
jgi:hypothetical protein